MQYLPDDRRAAFKDLVRSRGAAESTADAPLAWLRFEPVGEEAAVRLTVWPGGTDHTLARRGSTASTSAGSASDGGGGERHQVSVPGGGAGAAGILPSRTKTGVSSGTCPGSVSAAASGMRTQPFEAG